MPVAQSRLNLHADVKSFAIEFYLLKAGVCIYFN